MKTQKKINFDYSVPSVLQKGVSSRGGESVIYLNKSFKKQYAMGWGRIEKVIKSEEYDIVVLDTGKRGLYRTLICCETNARKQIYILKRNHYTEFLALSLRGKKSLYALAFNPVFIPNVVDRRKLVKNDEIDYELAQSDMQEITEANDFLQEFLVKGDEENGK